MTGVLTNVSAGVVVAAAACAAEAASITLIADTRSVSVSAGATDAEGDVTDSLDATGLFGEAFDAAFRIRVESPQGLAGSDARVLQRSTMFEPRNGRLDLAALLEAGSDSFIAFGDLFDPRTSTRAWPISTFELIFEVSDTIRYHLSVAMKTRGDAMVSFQAFDFSESIAPVGSMSRSQNHRGIAGPGRHVIRASVLAPSDPQAGHSSGNVDFNVTAVAAPMPAAVVPGATLLLGAMLSRGRRGTGDVCGA